MEDEAADLAVAQPFELGLGGEPLAMALLRMRSMSRPRPSSAIEM
jgi:hypothetical protein